jgi:3-methyl-2-oxobutanoate hydroxymethyltransferase
MSEQTPSSQPSSRPSSTEQPNPYGGRVIVPDAAAPGAVPGPRRVRIHHLREMKQRGEKFAMLTAYDQYAAAIFEEAGIPVLLVGDSAANNVLGYETTVPVTVDELVPLVRAVTRSARRSLVVADLPFGSYQSGPEQALATSMRMMKEGLAHSVKLEGGARIAPSVEQIVGAGIPVMAHVGFTPQSEHALGGYRVQGRGASGVERLVDDALALEAAGAFAIVLEMVPAPAAAEVTKALSIPTIGIGAGPDCDGQVLVWQDMMGLRTGKAPRFVKRYADLHGVMLDAAKAYADDVRAGSFPAAEHSFDS